jgi:hypothetical protein
MEMALLLGFWDISELPKVWLGVMEPPQSGTVFGVPEPVTCAEAIADRAMRGKLPNNRNPSRCIVVFVVGGKGPGSLSDFFVPPYEVLPGVVRPVGAERAAPRNVRSTANLSSLTPTEPAIEFRLE